VDLQLSFRERNRVRAEQELKETGIAQLIHTASGFREPRLERGEPLLGELVVPAPAPMLLLAALDVSSGGCPRLPRRARRSSRW
jgi:hypothetical protein